MTRIGGAWMKEDKNGKPYYSATLDKAIQPLTITPDKKLNFYFNENKKDNENAPDLIIDIFCPEQQKQQKQQETEEEVF
ncbi:MAG: hypothetical protein NC191_03775 [Muribaculaceae bacterium]|nr:hypothetical protein [Muribaculaceae bacterium]